MVCAMCGGALVRERPAWRGNGSGWAYVGGTKVAAQARMHWCAMLEVARWAVSTGLV